MPLLQLSFNTSCLCSHARCITSRDCPFLVEHTAMTVSGDDGLSVQTGSLVAVQLAKLMKAPVDAYNDVLTLLSLPHFGPLFDYVDYSGRKVMSCYLIENALDNETVIPTVEQVNGVRT